MMNHSLTLWKYMPWVVPWMWHRL